MTGLWTRKVHRNAKCALEERDMHLEKKDKPHRDHPSLALCSVWTAEPWYRLER